MQSSRINLNDNVNEYFPFTIGGVDFDLKYPTLEELEPIQTINGEREKAVSEKNTAKVAELDKKLEETFYSFIKPVDGATNIQDILKKQPFPVVKAFNKMIQEQLSAD